MRSMKSAVYAVALVGLALTLGGCYDREGPGLMGYGYGMHERIAAAPAPYMNEEMQVSRHRSGPKCDYPGWTFSPKLGKCVDPVTHDIPLSEQQKAVFASCQRIVTRDIVRGNRLVHRQKGINCH